ncbi:hypothetical protein CH063_08082 [Colletotrichum higginsianum]|uniref:Uncharacterized protein n=1 Tax=Colletotrichum higginsianum (strain IMI 349063) TaxID=759273 RepID=H1V8H5_COLHI|nr:hypothetical protein CH63R_11169 [Colletotrichum higginsianum IMI 349063]OBR04466.1 hypothetical protein CH63R_11169 [Colletotrichum higginsianum IMI 349063]GJC99103.1 hypothetical protein ColKHC_07929 [Colletotrichum higginsianum]CCF36528.1 hypothetical protein CH063_08082 [Colletotrichum higginsianum]
MASRTAFHRVTTLLLLVFLLFHEVLASGCTQVHCQVSVCASNTDEAFDVASLGLVGIMGPDCASWIPGLPTNEGQGSCAPGLKEYRGNLTIWRAWTARGNDYSAMFAQWGNFLGATCIGGKTVKCSPKSGEFPSSVTGKCQRKRW